jgi:hypothetical protein
VKGGFDTIDARLGVGVPKNMYSSLSMCVLDWSAISSIGALVNCALVFWLIRVTIRYVEVNAEIARSSKAMLDTVAQQLRDSRAEIAGPVLAALSDELCFLERWLIWTSDQTFEGSMMNNRESFVVVNYDDTLNAASRISVDVYRKMIFARQQLGLFETWINRERADFDRDTFRSALSGMRKFLTESSECLSLAQYQVQKYLNIGV